MLNSNFMNVFLALERIINGYESIKTDMVNLNEFKVATLEFTKKLLSDHRVASIAKIKDNLITDEKINLGSCFNKLSAPPEIAAIISDAFKSTYQNGTFQIPFEIDLHKNFNLLFNVDDFSRNLCENLIQFILLSTVKHFQRGAFEWRCIDAQRSGSSYGTLIQIISTDKNLFGGEVFATDKPISNVIDELEQKSRDRIAQLQGQYESIYEYNQYSSKKIPAILAVFCDLSRANGYDNIQKLNKVVESGWKTGINVIIIEDKNVEIKLSTADFLQFSFEKDGEFITNDNYKAPIILNDLEISVKDVKSVVTEFSKIEKVDTRFESHFSTQNDLFTMDSTDMLRIPFAFDEDGKINYLEIGGEAPPHALLSGSTGSGKSVTLHTIIEQIMLNYHPDDVEIWAIDYKAVEFGCYAEKKTPHIRIVGQDNSEDFSLSLLDLINAEYERRKKLFIDESVKDFKTYRKKFGNRSLPRILIIIDEFHNLTQAVQNYNGDKNYRIILENLLRQMRAMGMSFFFCSQTINAGLSGLTEAGRNQIGCRLCMKHEDASEIRETLSLSSTNTIDIEDIKNIRRGQLIYKKIKTESIIGDQSLGYHLLKLNVIFISDEKRNEIIDIVVDSLGTDFIPKDDIICKNSERYYVSEKDRHSLSLFLNSKYQPSYEGIELFFGAPTSLDDEFKIVLENESGANVLLIGESDNLRESIIVTTVCGLLMNKNNSVIVSIIDDNNEDSLRLYKHLLNIKGNNLTLLFGASEVLNQIRCLNKIKPLRGERKIMLWYGLNKLKNAVYLMSQEDVEIKNSIPPIDDNPIKAMQELLNKIKGTSEINELNINTEQFSFEDYKGILQRLWEYGPENGYFNIVIFNNVKAMKKTTITPLNDFEHRIGLKMSTDDSYDLFGISNFTNKADDKTAIYYNGSRVGKTFRPFLIPTDDWFNEFNKKLGGNM